ncbi:Sporulation domain protein [Alkaliphilus metalliredigens QYMF]|uniref:Sporulation domain protein n=1 Tax=Alkaliphilus metalliredigens (strain QYMF) TaxID=293826 RepID=A6TR83_ALKMQ|nr:SPOR domain-containing protein [Alkaliphilus metalliredigens]ABR48701.1 Sporulation domain protein [Alkaliphilus metalliredigens QYMF]
MSNSPLVNHTNISPNSTNPRRDKIRKITIHHVAGNLSVERVGEIFKPSSRRASSNYGVDNRGRVGMYVEEKNRAWTSSSAANDNQAVTIEVANSGGAPNWPVSDVALEKTVELCVDICKRNGIEKLNFTGDERGNLTMHKWFAATNCPGPYLESKFPYIADEVNKRLSGPATKPPNGNVLYRVQTGAFSNRANADALAARVEAAGFDTYMVKVDGLYKVQVGAYSNKSNAESQARKLKSKGFDTFITTQSGEPVSPGSSAATIKKGSRVKVRNGAKTYTGGNLASFVYARVYDVQHISGDRVVISSNGQVTAAMKKNDLILQ